MITPERRQDGTMRYRVALKGQYDGCVLEVVYSPEGNMAIGLRDGVDNERLEEIKIKVGKRLGDDGRQLLLANVTSRTRLVMDASWEKEFDLMDLGGWWLSEVFHSNVSITKNGQKVVMGNEQEETWRVEEVLLGERQMDAFFQGRKVNLHDHLTLQVSLEKGAAGSYFLKTFMDEGEMTVGALWGEVVDHEGGDLEVNLSVWATSWGRDDPAYHLKDDLMALTIRWLRSHFEAKQIRVTCEKRPIETMKDSEVDERSRFWLGF